LYNTRQPSFPLAATIISANNVQIAFQMTNAPSSTPTATDDQGNNTSGDVPVTLTATPSPTNATPVPSTTPTSTDIQPTSTVAPSQTRVALVNTVPPTNTRRPAPATNTKSPVPSTAPSLAPTTSEPPTATVTAVANTATIAATPTVAASPTPGATIAPTLPLPTVFLYQALDEKPQVTAIPTHAPRVKANGDDIMNIALMGSDQDVDPTDPSYRTDSIVIVSINRTTNTVAMLSIPRDLFVYIPTLGMQRVNTAYQWGEAVKYTPGGGFGLLQQTILYNLGIPIHYYAKVSLTGFKQIVDTLNGVDLAVDCPISDLKFQGQYDDKGTPVYSPYAMAPGYYHMDGSTALWYARMRHSTSDFDRNRRQQQVLKALWRTARDQGLITKAPQLWSQLTQIVDTNLPLPDVLSLVPVALNLKPSDVTSYTMNKGYELQHWTDPAGEDVQLPDPVGFFKTINNFYTPPSANKLGAQAPAIEVVNGTGINGDDKVAADALTWQGFQVQAKGDGDAAAKTVVYDLTGSANPGTLNALLKTINAKPSAVVSQPDPNRTADFRIVLGKDYNSCSAPGFAQ
jgi:polyisoprenyl-teichoic acid--peptidoglycan teichoic acid transferase